MYKLAIFDLDGTLLDTLDDLAAACNFALVNCGFPKRPLLDYKQLVGRGIYNLFRGAVPEGCGDEATVERMASFFLPYYNAHKCDFTKPYGGIPELLDALSDRGVKLAVASNKYQEGAEQLVGKFFGKHEFVRILGQREGQPIKPDPAIVHQIMALVPEISMEEVAYIGDSNVDMQTGINAGVATFGVTWGFRSREELLACGPDALADSAEELRSLILG